MKLDADKIDDLLEWPITLSCHEMRTLLRLFDDLTIKEMARRKLNPSEVRSIFTMHRELIRTFAEMHLSDD